MVGLMYLVTVLLTPRAKSAVWTPIPYVEPRAALMSHDNKAEIEVRLTLCYRIYVYLLIIYINSCTWACLFCSSYFRMITSAGYTKLLFVMS